MSRRRARVTAPYCWLTLCPLLDWLGAKYRTGGRQPLRGIASAAQTAWFYTHNNRFYCWLAKQWLQ